MYGQIYFLAGDVSCAAEVVVLVHVGKQHV